MNTQIQPSNLIGNLGQLNSSAWSVHRELGHQHGPAQSYDNIRRRGTIPPYGSAKVQPCWQNQPGLMICWQYQPSNWAILRGLPSMAVPRHKFSWQHPLNSPPWSVHRKLGHQHRPAQPHDDARRGGTILLAATTGANSLLAVSTATLQPSHPPALT